MSAETHLPLYHRMRSEPVYAITEEGPLRYGVAEWAMVFRRLFAGAVPVCLTSVSDWWDAQNGGDEWPDDALDPDYRIPWPRVWCEWRDHRDAGALKGLVLEGVTLDSGMSGREWLERNFIAPLKELTGQLPVTGLDSPDVDEILGPGAAGIVTGQPFLGNPDGPGVMCLPPVVWSYTAAGERSHNVMGMGGERFAEATVGQLQPWWLFTALLKVHPLRTEEVAVPRPARRRAQREGRPLPWVTYKQLTFAVPGTREGGHPTGLHHRTSRQHIVRGHIADYREGKGLFGRLRQLVWLPAHLRGDSSIGGVAKVYRPIVERS